MEAPVSLPRISLSNTRLPRVSSEETVKILNLVRMADEAIDLLVHKVDEDLTAFLVENFSDQTERCASPAEGINECEGWN